jgi:hypothetical protein
MSEVGISKKDGNESVALLEAAVQDIEITNRVNPLDEEGYARIAVAIRRLLRLPFAHLLSSQPEVLQ